MSILILRVTILQLGGCLIIFGRKLQDVEVFSCACVWAAKKRPRRRLLPEIPGSFVRFCVFPHRVMAVL